MIGGPRSSRSGRRGADGFTLIEVMVALAVLGSALFVLLEAHYAALRNQNELRDEVLLRSLVSQAMGIAEVEVAGGNYKDSEEFGKRYPDYKYSFDAQPVGEQYPALYDVLVTVEGPNVKREVHSFMLTRDPNAFLSFAGGALGTGESAAPTQPETAVGGSQ